MKPRIFIGSSTEGLGLAEAVQQNLDYFAHVTIWDKGVFALSTSTLQSLINALDNFDFAIFIFSPDDSIKIREQQYLTVRDNVIYEMGLFTGRLGPECVFFLKPRKQEVKIPTDLLGITPGTYDEENGDLNSAVRNFTTDVKKQIEQQIKFHFPEKGFWGDNLLSESVSIIIPNTSYSIKCIAPKIVHPVLLIKNISASGQVQSPGQGWFLGIGKDKNIDHEVFDRTNQEQIFRFMHHEGDREISFQGSGKAQFILSDPSGKIILDKTIDWG